MRVEIIQKLNKINLDFYNTTSEYFDRSRKYSWEGWERLINNYELRINNVLDLGCGNGRFYEFLEKNLSNDFEYFGVDSNEYLLRVALESYSKDNAEFEHLDFISDLISGKEIKFDKKFDLIVLFGVMHHIPSYALRLGIVKKLKSFLTPNGALVLSLWNFLDDERIKNKIESWESVEIDQSELEQNDYLLGWDRGVKALRYCHYFSEDEIEKLVKDSGLKLKDKFKAEGKLNNLNTYLVLEN